MQTPFLGGAYALRSLPLSAQTLVNLYAEYNESKEGAMGALYGTPGLKLLVAGDGGPGRDLRTTGDGSLLYMVSGANVYKVDKNWSQTLIGQLTTAAGPISSVSNQTQTLFSHGGGWHYTTGTNLTLVPAGPPGAIVTFMDGYVIFTEQNDDQFGITAIDDVSSIDPLDIAEAEAVPDGLLSVYADQREVWMLSRESTEIWADTGAATFPFERIPGGVLSVGCVAPRSVAYQDGSLFWLSRDKNGTLMVIRTVGYQTERVSTHAIEEEFSSYATVHDAYGWGYTQEGHAFYVISFPTADKTWAYDCSAPPEARWARRAYRDSTGVLHRHKAAAYAHFNNTHVVIDRDSGALYSLDLNTYTDNGSVIYRERAWPLAAPQEMRRMRCDSLELVQEAGVGNSADTNPATWLQMSFDGGVSFGYERYQKAGPIGSRQSRMRWRRNGMGRRPVAKVATTSKGKVAWLGANVTGEMLAL